MAVNLSKGEKISLEKAGGTGLSKVALGLSWGMREKKGFFGTKKIEVDLDASCLLFNSNEPVDVVWFQQLQSNCGAIHHSGDDRSGGGSSADNEVISVDLSHLPGQVNTLIFTVNSFLNDSFSGIPDATCRLLDGTNGRELARFNLSLDGGNHTGMVMAKLYRDGSGWHMQAIGDKGYGRTFQDMMPLISRYL
jgi:tellurium resistance protein TerZ